jgi:hypothetical protein
MQAKLILTLIIAIVAVAGLSMPAFSQLQVGVKKGDWIEYNVTYTGAPSAGHDINWARMEILDVQSSNISAEITSRFSNGSTENLTSTLNLATGHMIDDFVIPANLKSGDTFLDENFGNMSITKVEKHEYVNATRTVLYASAGNNTYIWDQATGVSVEGNSIASDYTMHTLVSATNLWQPSIGLDQTETFIELAIVLAVIVIVVILAVVLYYRRIESRRDVK